MQTPKHVRAAMNRPTRSEHRGANIAVVTVGFAIALRARSPVNPRPFGRETWRDFGPSLPPRAAGSPDAGYGGLKARDVADGGPSRQPSRNVGQKSKTPPRSLGGPNLKVG